MAASKELAMARLHGASSSENLLSAEQPHVDHDVVVGAKRNKVADFVASALRARHYVVNVNSVLKAADHAALPIGAHGQCPPVTSRLRDASNLPGPSFASALGGAVLIRPVLELVGQHLNGRSADGAAHLNAFPLRMGFARQASSVAVSATGRAIRSAGHGFGGPTEQVAAKKAGSLYSRLPAPTAVVAGNKEPPIRHRLPATTLAKPHSLMAQRPNTHES